jgi:hypothetical protein
MARARYKLLVDALVADIRAGRLPPGSTTARSLDWKSKSGRTRPTVKQ